MVGFDKTGDGLVDVAYGDQTPNDAGAQGGYDTQIVLNKDGTIYGMIKDGAYVDSQGEGTPAATNSGNSTFDIELSGVDLNNDGTVDLIYHGSTGSSKIGGAGTSVDTSLNDYRLVVASNLGNGTWYANQIVENAFQRTSEDPGVGNGVSMTWADFNGDGYMDLFMGRGYGSTTAGGYASRILFNDGTGHLSSSAPTGVGTSTGTYTFADSLQGGASLAVDWNNDGKMDVIELPGMGDDAGMTDAGNTGAINLYTNTSSGTTKSFTTTNLLGGSNTIGSWTSDSNNNSVTGAIAADIDWDGDKDLVAFTSQGNTKYIANTNNVADGTVIHVRIFDKTGINSFYGNTVQLIDEATNTVVRTQMINAQSGNQTNDSSALVDFTGLDASKTYSVVMLSNVNGSSSDYGGVGAVGSNTVENVNATWGGLTAGEGTSAYVLTAESSSSVANANIGNGIVGTGYNDTFYATLGTDKFNGGGGSVTVSGVTSWSNTGGLDVVDYELAGSAPLTIDLSVTTAQSTGFGSDTFVNIEGIAGGSGNDTFTDSAADNLFNGRGGNDTYNLTKGGNDTLMYTLLNSANATGGNGVDTVNSFKVGTWEATADADRIDVSQLLNGYTPSINGEYAAKYINGVATINAGDNIAQYLSVTTSGGNTTVSIDRDGSGGAYQSTTLVTLNGVETDLATLLANHQISLI